MAKTLKLAFDIDEKVLVDGRAGWVEHFQLTRDRRKLYYVASVDADGRPSSSWVAEADLSAFADAPTA